LVQRLHGNFIQRVRAHIFIKYESFFSDSVETPMRGATQACVCSICLEIEVYRPYPGRRADRPGAIATQRLEPSFHARCPPHPPRLRQPDPRRFKRGVGYREQVAIAAPFFRAEGEVAGSLAVCGPAVRIEPEREAQYGALVAREALGLSQVLGYKAAAT
jgi:hypothetical protein